MPKHRAKAQFQSAFERKGTGPETILTPLLDSSNSPPMLSKTVLYHGSPQPVPEPIQLRAGPLSLQFEPLTGFLRYIRIGDHEIIRAIYGAVRDQNWGTVPPHLHNLTQRIDKNSFALEFDVRCQQREIDYLWHGLITGSEDGTISYSFQGEARSEFFRNRIGICLLHPNLECAGQPCTVEHSDGTSEEGQFPKNIAAWQPFVDVRRISYAVSGVRATITFEGDQFEMEDQRNWSDASFKTYCTPQSRPKPMLVRPAEQVRQTVELKIAKPERPVLPVLLGRPAQLSIATTPVHPLPPIGFALPANASPLTPRQTERLRILRPAHLRVELRLAENFVPQLKTAVEQSNALGCPLHLALIISDAALDELKNFSSRMSVVRPRVALWLLYHEREEAIQERWVALAHELLTPHAPGVLFAAGTLDFFTELNRNRPPANSGAFPCFSINPQVHAFDDATMVENLAGAATQLESVRVFSAKPAVVSPITLKIRTKGSAQPAGELPTDVDPRQMSLFGAGWTLGMIAQLAATNNAHSLTFYETVGWRGLLEQESGSPLPAHFPSTTGTVFPLYHIFADIGEFPGKQVYPTHSSHPLVTEGLTLVDSTGRRRVLVANLTARQHEIKIKSGTCRGTVRYLDERNAETAMRDPEVFRQEPGESIEAAGGKLALTLLPFAIARIDIAKN